MPYIRRCLTRALAGSVLFTDKLSIVAAPLISGTYFIATGRPMDEIVGAYVAMAVMVLVAGVVFLRLITAPYFIWKEDQAEIARLNALLGDPKVRARRSIEDRLSAARVSVLEFLSSHRISFAVVEKRPRRLYDYPEFFKPLNLLAIEHPELLSMAARLDELHDSLYGFYEQDAADKAEEAELARSFRETRAGIIEVVAIKGGLQ